MKRLLILLALCAGIAVPAAVIAQQAGPGPGMQGGPSADQRATFDKIRADAKASAFAALTPAHAASVQAIVAQVGSGALDRRTAATQIDALLTADEKTAVTAAAEKSRAQMRTAFAAGGGPPGPPAGAAARPAGPPPPGAGGPPGPGRFGPPSAGRFLLTVSLSRDQMRSTEPRARSSSAP